MKSRNKKPSRRVDVREPLEKLSLLTVRKSGKDERRDGNAGADPKTARSARWM